MVPAVLPAVIHVIVLECAPFLEQDGSSVLPQEEGTQCFLERAPKEHRSASILLSPPFEIAVAITTWAGQILTNLRVAINHQATPAVGLETEADSSSHWLAGANPSKFSHDLPFRVTWLTFTTPRSPNRAFSSISSRPSRSGSYKKSRKNQPSFHSALAVQ